MKHTITKTDLKLNPTLEAKVGDEIEIPKGFIQLGDHEVLLTDGRVAKVLTGKGKDMLEAQQLAGEDATKVQSILMQRLVKIRPGVDETAGAHKKVAIEELEELPMKDFSAIQVVFAEINF